MTFKNFLITSVIAFGLISKTMAQIPNYIPTNGLVSWWPFNGNANDESGNGNNGTVSGATLAIDRFGLSSRAYSFNGTNSFISGNAGTFPLGNSTRSISGWINKTGLPTTTFADVIFLYGVASPGGWFGPINGKPNNIYTIGLSQYGPGNDFHVNQNYSLNTWYHYAITYKNDTVKIFINSQLAGTGVINPINTGSGSFFFGYANANSYFEGKLDDFGVWNRVLTQNEIKDMYRASICYQNITVTDTLIINMGISSFDPIIYGNSIKIYPNPTRDHITINYENFASINGYKIKIENSLGQQVFASNISQQSDYVNLSSWGGNGIYFVKIIDGQGNTIDIRKIVLQ